MEKAIKKVVLTGGHAGSTAYAFAERLIKDKSYRWDIFWIGSKSAVEGKEVATLESKVLPSLGVKFFTITTGRIQRRFTVYTIPSLFKIPVGFFQAFLIFLKVKPDVIVSFGGYAAFPVVVLGKIFGSPVIIHEQTFVFGRANKLAEIFASKIALARKESLKYFDKSKSVVIGNPVSQEILNVVPRSVMGKPPTIFITGGSRGSEEINNVVGLILPKLLVSYNVIHQVGEHSLEKFLLIKESLGESGINYSVHGVIEPPLWSRVIAKADLVISRAGANIVSEIIAARKPSILIPIPWTFMDEQTKNAEYARDFGVATILYQKDLNAEKLLKEINHTFSIWEKIVNSTKGKQNPDRGAAERLVAILKDTLK